MLFSLCFNIEALFPRHRHLRYYDIINCLNLGTLLECNQCASNGAVKGSHYEQTNTVRKYIMCWMDGNQQLPMNLWQQHRWAVAAVQLKGWLFLLWLDAIPGVKPIQLSARQISRVLSLRRVCLVRPAGCSHCPLPRRLVDDSLSQAKKAQVLSWRNPYCIILNLNGSFTRDKDGFSRVAT